MMRHMQTLFVCDFDGVLNPIPFEKEWVGPEHDVSAFGFEMIDPKNWKTVQREIDADVYFMPDRTEKVTVSDELGYESTYIIRWSTELVERISELVESGAIEFLWLTTWRQNAQDALAPLLGFDPGWKHLPWQSRRSDYDHVGKLIALEDVIDKGEDRPVVWIDDVATHRVENYSYLYGGEDRPYPESRDSRSTLVNHDSGYLAVQPSTLFGISRAEWHAIEKFIESKA
jgi:hypothetical protein